MSENREQQMVRIHIVGSQFEADQVLEVLREAGMPAEFNSFHDTALDGLYQHQKGFGEIRVPSSRLDEATKLLEAELSALAEVEPDALETEALNAENEKRLARGGTSGATYGRSDPKTWIWLVLLGIALFVAGYFASRDPDRQVMPKPPPTQTRFPW